MTAGRPKKIIDYEAVSKLAAIQCTQAEIASFLGCSVDTLQRDEKFSGLYKEAIERGKMSLRRYQWKALEEGNTTMLIWLGKQYLGQKDERFLDATIKDERNVIRAPEMSETPADWQSTYTPKPH